MREEYKKFINASIWVAVILFCVRCFIDWKTMSSNFYVYDVWGYAGEAIGLTSVIMLIYEKWLWKYNMFCSTPVLSKVYLGKVRSSYGNLERNVKLEVKQTLLSVNIILISGESRSRSISSSIDDILGEKQLTYCYLNKPKNEYRTRSEIHYGTAMLCIQNKDVLEGHYYTDRNTRGDMKFFAEGKNKKRKE